MSNAITAEIKAIALKSLTVSGHETVRSTIFNLLAEKLLSFSTP